MARYCSAQDNVRTRQSPPYRETIRVNVLHGRKSMSWAKSVLPLFTGTSSETFRKVPDRVQIDTTLNRQNRLQNHPFIGRHRLLNRTAVIATDNRYRTEVRPSIVTVRTSKFEAPLIKSSNVTLPSLGRRRRAAIEWLQRTFTSMLSIIFGL